METMWILKGAGFIALGIALVLLVTYVLMRLWNGLVPQLFNGPRLRFLQALGLLFLTRLLFGGFGGYRGYGWRGYDGYNKQSYFHRHHQTPPTKHNTDTTAVYRQ
ncbi:hypothetical protein GCM10023187_38570 [Nibrella viscosa]|uniref:Uncharacterized protein n=1 Tax=Nibrella viscosa TaxID=1084524 RepID=A0ABP8KPT5_9BACT